MHHQESDRDWAPAW